VPVAGVVDCDREKLVIVCVEEGRQQTLILLLPGFGLKMGGTVTFWALHPPGRTAWCAWRVAGTAAHHASQKVTVPVFPVTSVDADREMHRVSTRKAKQKGEVWIVWWAWLPSRFPISNLVLWTKMKSPCMPTLLPFLAS
jgi:hypothetical protein